MGAVGEVVKAVPVVGDIYKEGTEGNKATQNTASDSGIHLGKASELEKNAGKTISTQFDEVSKFLSGGFGQKEIDASNQEQRNYVDMLSQITQNGGAANDTDRANAQRFANDLFNPQQVGMDQSYQDQQQQAARLAAQLGRPINDPVIQTKLAQERMRQQQMFDANKSSFMAQEIRASPFQRLDLQGQLANARGGLATQAMQNRMTLMSLGQNLQNDERNWRMQTGTKFGNSNTTQMSGGGILGGIGAVTGAAGSIMGVIGQAKGIPGASGGTAQGAQQMPTMQQAPMTITGSAPQQPQSYGDSRYTTQQNPYAMSSFTGSNRGMR